MKAAKIITFISFILYGLWTVASIFVFFSLKQTFQELDVEMPFPWPFVVLVIYTTCIFIFWLYLRNKEQKGETFGHTLMLSIALLLIPLILFFILSILSFNQPFNQPLDLILESL